MGIQSTTARDAELAAKRQAFMDRHRLKDYMRSGRHLMKMVLASTDDKALVDQIRKRFTRQYGTDLHFECSRTWDHLEMMGRDKRALLLVAHPYHITAEGRADMELFRRAGLKVVEAGQDESWYGYGSYQIRIEHRDF